MTNVRMKYKDYEFPSNPEKTEIIAGTNVGVAHIFNSVDIAQNVSVKPVVIRGSGYFYGDRAEEECAYLSHLLKDRSAGTLICPGLYSLRAYMTEFSYRLSAEHSRAEYSFEFVQAENNYSDRAVDYVEVYEGENMFDIAGRTGISVSRLMLLNDFRTPFDLSAGERVMIK